MTGGIRIGKLFGIDIAIHPSWFIVLALFSYTLGTGFFPSAYPGWAVATTWAIAVLASLLLFASVLAHELGHSLVARHQGIPVKHITLFLLGGVASIEKEASSPGREALLAGVGPLVSALIGAVTLGLAYLVNRPEQLQAVLFYLGVANLSLAVFNLLPGFPMDGGRVLRAVLWARSKDFAQATVRATRVGQVFGYLFIALGAVELLYDSAVGGLWMAFIGWAIVQASRASGAQAKLEGRLEGLSTGQLMSRPAGWVPPSITIGAALNREGGMRDYDDRCLAVDEDGDGYPEGLVCAADLREVPREDWDLRRVRDLMVDAEHLPIVGPDTPVVDAVRLMRARGTDRALVVQDGRLVGFIDDAAVARYVRYGSRITTTAQSSASTPSA